MEHLIRLLRRHLPSGGAPRIFNSSRAISPLAKPLVRFASKRPLRRGRVRTGCMPRLRVLLAFTGGRLIAAPTESNTRKRA